MNIFFKLLVFILVIFTTSCARAPISNPSKVSSECAQKCSVDLATCGSGFKLFPVIQQQQCNDNYDICIGGCPIRKSAASSIKNRLQEVDTLFRSGVINQKEYSTKRQEIIDSL